MINRKYFYSIVPAIWILELNTNRRAVLCLYIELIQSSLVSECGLIRRMLFTVQRGIKWMTWHPVGIKPTGSAVKGLYLS